MESCSIDWHKGKGIHRSSSRPNHPNLPNIDGRCNKIGCPIRQTNGCLERTVAELSAELKNENVDVERVLAEYQKLELKTERDLCRKLRDILDPDQFVSLVKQWGKTLDMPIVAVFLDLSDEQYELVLKDSALFENLKTDLLRKARAIDPKSPLQKISSNPDFYRAMYKPYSHLSPDQFLRANIFLMEWTGCKSFDDRLKVLNEDKHRSTDVEKVRMKIELEVLGDLYRKGADVEKAKQ